MKTPRTFDQIRADAITRPQRQAGKDILSREAEIHFQRGKLRLPTEHEAVIAWYFRKPFTKLEGDDRVFAEKVAVAHDPREVAVFSETHLESMLSDDALGTKKLIKEINAALVSEVDKEIENVREYLQAAWGALPVEGQVDDAEPLRWLRHRRWLASEAAVSGAGGVNGVRSALNGLI